MHVWLYDKYRVGMFEYISDICLHNRDIFYLFQIRLEESFYLLYILIENLCQLK